MAATKRLKIKAIQAHKQKVNKEDTVSMRTIGLFEESLFLPLKVSKSTHKSDKDQKGVLFDFEMQIPRDWLIQ